MKTYNDCLPCFVSQALSTVRRFGADGEAEEQAMRAVLGVLAGADYRLPPPRIAPDVYGAIHQALNTSDPYREIKRECNQQALALYPALKSRVEASDDPFGTAVLMSLAGNIVDFGTGKPFDLEATIERVLASKPAVDHTELLRQRLDQAQDLLFLADNTGEIVLDRLLLEHLPNRPRRVVVAVRGGPTINDATLEDARAVGLEQLGVELIEPGVTLPGIALEESSAEFRSAFDSADLIVSKGQGNYETLLEVLDRPIFFLFMVKCEMVARQTGHAMGSPMVAFNQRLFGG